MSEAQNPVYTDNVSVIGDGTAAHPLASTGSQLAPPGADVTITAGDTGGMLFAMFGSDEPNDIEITNLETGGTFELASDGSFEIRSFSASVVLKDNAASKIVEAGGTGQLAFFGAALAAKPTITGAKAGNAALASLLSHLATLGLITDSTT